MFFFILKKKKLEKERDLLSPGRYTATLFITLSLYARTSKRKKREESRPL